MTSIVAIALARRNPALLAVSALLLQLAVSSCQPLHPPRSSEVDAGTSVPLAAADGGNVQADGGNGQADGGSDLSACLLGWWVQQNAHCGTCTAAECQATDCQRLVVNGFLSGKTHWHVEVWASESRHSMSSVSVPDVTLTNRAGTYTVAGSTVTVTDLSSTSFVASCSGDQLMQDGWYSVRRASPGVTESLQAALSSVPPWNAVAYVP